ncbi:MAG: penicillin-binding protein activator [Syntrophaceae bacterium]|nr:penicillin-binding protein activator [Syntrophaceae bacterium]
MLAGLDLFDGNRALAVLRIEDYEGRPEEAARAVERLAAEPGVMAIIGPPEADAARAAAEAAQAAQIPLLVLGPVDLPGVPREFVFSELRSDRREAVALASYAVKDLGLSRLAIFHPSHAYGTSMAGAFREEALRLGAKVRRVQAYRTDQTDFSAEIRKLAAFRNPRPPTKKRGVEAAKPAPAPALDFDALYIPDAFSRLQMILPQLSFHDVRGVQLLGTSLWYSPEGIRREADFFEGAILTAPFFAESDKPAVRDFADTIFGATGREPDYREALAFDTARMLGETLRDRAVRDRRSLLVRLKQIESFEGVTGRVSVSKTGEMRRRPFILKVEGKSIVDITPAY